MDSSGTFGSVFFYVSTSDGGFQTGPFGIRVTGPQIYTGTLSAPIFSVGKFVLDSGTLTVTAVPEPSTWAMMLAGFAGLGFAGYRATRRTTALRV